MDKIVKLRPRVNFEERREQYISIASGVMLRNGIAKTTMQDIADVAGVQKVLIYRVFPSKAALMEAIFQKVVGEIHKVYLEGDYIYGARVRSLAHAARDCPETFLLVLKYSQSGLEQPEWTRLIHEIFAGYTLDGWFRPARDAPSGAVERAKYASLLHVGAIIETLVRWIEDADGLSEIERMRWWSRIAREYHLASREVFRLGTRTYNYTLFQDAGGAAIDQ